MRGPYRASPHYVVQVSSLRAEEIGRRVEGSMDEVLKGWDGETCRSVADAIRPLGVAKYSGGQGDRGVVRDGSMTECYGR